MANDKKVEEALQFVEGLKKRWMATVDAIPDPLMIVDKNHKIIKGNKALADLGSMGVREVLGQSCYKVFANRSSPCPNCKMLDSFKDAKDIQYELHGAREERYHEVAAQPIYDSEGEIEGVLTIYRDRTEAKALREQLTQNEKLASIGLLAGGIAHEINNPLGGILIFSQMILRELDQESSHYPDVQEIEAAALRCKDIVENLLDFARGHTDVSRKQQLETVDIADALLAALRFGLVGNNKRDVEVVKELDDKPFLIESTRNKVIQLFLNLIQNAIQAMPNGGTLTVRSHEVDLDGKAFACFEVIDSGIGIPQKAIDKIFDPFYTSKSSGEGTGLGLSICHGIVTEMGGTIKVESTLGEETRFKVFFPLLQDALAQKTS